MAERPQCESCKLYELQSERDADDRDAEKDSHDKVIKADDETAEHEPEDVS